MAATSDQPGRSVRMQGSRVFADRFPVLFHVTRRSAVAAIGRDGLQPAAALAAARGASSLLSESRAHWTALPAPDADTAWLRWQRLADHVLRTRLPPDTTPAAWRDLINGMVFLFGSLEDARTLQRAPADREIDQVVLRAPTAALVAAGCDLRFCRWNNGYPDRTRPPRLRAATDYRPIAEWRRGEPVREITIRGTVPASVAFEVVADPG